MSIDTSYEEAIQFTRDHGRVLQLHMSHRTHIHSIPE